MPYPKEKLHWNDILATFFGILIFVAFIGAVFICFFNLKHIDDNQLDISKWNGYSPIAIYEIYDKDTGACYAITETGSICSMYDTNGEIKFIDQGN